jgi:hypothetical protein|tara:strand:- start:2124 stop:2321 length:198 start_codon:yes stop_codon:yes gene_type:complete
MKLKLFCCPWCARGRRFESIGALNIHIGKNHQVDYKIFMKNNKPFVKKKIPRVTGVYLDKVTPRH